MSDHQSDITTVAIYRSSSPLRRTVQVEENGGSETRILSVAFDGAPGADPAEIREHLARMAFAPINGGRRNGSSEGLSEAALAVLGVTPQSPELDHRSEPVESDVPVMAIGADGKPPTGIRGYTWAAMLRLWDECAGNMSEMTRRVNESRVAGRVSYNRIYAWVARARGTGDIAPADMA